MRQWIQQGAKVDHLPTRSWRRVLPSVPIDARVPTRVRCKVNVAAYLIATVRRPGPKGEVLWEDAVSLNKPKQKADVAEPGQPIQWDLRAGYGWPKRVRIELEIRYAASEPAGTEFTAQPLSVTRALRN
jgi:hypothetical protein